MYRDRKHEVVANRHLSLSSTSSSSYTFNNQPKNDKTRRKHCLNSKKCCVVTCLCTGGVAEGKLIEGDALTTGLDDAGAGGLGEAEGADGELGHVEKTGVIGDGTDDGGDAVALLALGEADEALKGKGGLPAAGLHQTLGDDGVELGVGATAQERVQAAQKLQVRILGLADGASIGALMGLGTLLLDSDGHDGEKKEVLLIFFWR